MTTRIITGDALEQLRLLPDESVHCCVTSPPYYGLRDYGVAGQIGLEPSPDEYVAALVAVFREVRRMLRSDGTLWLNIGDSYAGSWGAEGRRITDSNDASWHGSQIKNHPKRAVSARRFRPGNPDKNKGSSNRDGVGPIADIKSKDLIGIPWLLAFALRADGWWLRQDIIWSKPNPMPESVTDRCTKAHEYLFLLSKSERYFWDAEAIKEAAVAADLGAMDGGAQRLPDGSDANGGRNFRGHLPGNKSHKGTTAYLAGAIEHRTKEGLVKYSTKVNADPSQMLRRNKRSVWTIATSPFPEAHFATFPPALIEPCILAGCPKGGTVLDPFGGAGTTGLVADRLGRDAVLIELNPEYAEMARRRIYREAPLFADIAAG